MSEEQAPPTSLADGQASAGPLPAAEIIRRLQEENALPGEAGALTPAGSWRAGRFDRAGTLITGRLNAHGRANYQFRSDTRASYYLKILTRRGLQVVWGVDLERAITQSQTRPKIGAMIGAQRMGSEVVMIPPRRDAPPEQEGRTFRRTQWRVESVTYFAEAARRAQRARELQLENRAAIQEHPELRSAFINLHVARKYAAQHIADPAERELFLKRVREVIAASIYRGEPVPEPRLREHTARSRLGGAEGLPSKELQRPVR